MVTTTTIFIHASLSINTIHRARNYIDDEHKSRTYRLDSTRRTRSSGVLSERMCCSPAAKLYQRWSGPQISIHAFRDYKGQNGKLALHAKENFKNQKLLVGAKHCRERENQYNELPKCPIFHFSSIFLPKLAYTWFRLFPSLRLCQAQDLGTLGECKVATFQPRLEQGNIVQQHLKKKIGIR